MKNLILILFILGSIHCAFGQEQSRTYSKWYLKPAAGINIPITKLLTGDITDNLFEYDDHSYYLQFISGSYFFSQKWGMELTFQMCMSNNIHGREDSFNAQIQNQYGDAYFVNPGYSPGMYNSRSDVGVFLRGYIGLVYRIEKPKYIIIPKILIGTTGVATDSGTAYLKEKGAHTSLALSYKTENESESYLTIAPGLSFGYRLSKRFIANFDLVYSYYKTDFQFVKETRNTFTEEVWTETIDYNKGIHTLSLGVGLIIELGLGNK